MVNLEVMFVIHGGGRGSDFSVCGLLKHYITLAVSTTANSWKKQYQNYALVGRNFIFKIPSKCKLCCKISETRVTYLLVDIVEERSTLLC